MNPSSDFRLHIGRPCDEECTATENKVYEFLDSHGVEYKTLKHPAAFTIEECNKVRDFFHAPVFKNLFLTNKQQNRFYLLLMPGDKAFKTKYLSQQINSARLSFAGEEHMKKYLGVTPGSVTPMGLLNDLNKDVRLLIDSELKGCEDFACHPCINSASLLLKFRDLTDIVIPAMGHEIEWVELPRE